MGAGALPALSACAFRALPVLPADALEQPGEPDKSEHDRHDGNDAGHRIIHEGQDADAEENMQYVAGRLRGTGMRPERFAKDGDDGPRKSMAEAAEKPLEPVLVPGASKVEPPARIELATFSLRVRRSTN